MQGLVLVVAAPLVGVSFTVASFFQMVVFLLLLAFSLTAFGIVSRAAWSAWRASRW